MTVLLPDLGVLRAEYGAPNSLLCPYTQGIGQPKISVIVLAHIKVGGDYTDKHRPIKIRI